jgi:hypothetical protein
MAKAKKKDTPRQSKKPSKYDITLKLDMTFEEALKMAANTPPHKKKK